jgi:Sec-independent protein secretion pathway component TatC
MYIHRSVNITVGFGILVAVGILFAFYVMPTAFLTKIISKLKSAELSEIYQRQQSYYDRLIKEDLQGQALKEAYEYNQYCHEVVKSITLVPKWPHLAKVFGAFGLSISPALALSAMGLAGEWARFFLGRS